MATMQSRNFALGSRLRGFILKRGLVLPARKVRVIWDSDTIASRNLKSEDSYVPLGLSPTERSHKDKSNGSFNDSKRHLIYSLAFLTCLNAMSDDGNRDEETIVSIADSYYEKNETQQLYSYLFKEKNRKNAEILWRFARAARDYSQLSSTAKDEKRKLIYEGFSAAEEAVSLDEKSFGSHKWYGIMLSEIGDYEGTKRKIENSYKIRDHFLKAIELNPSDATSHYLLGVWFFTFADLPWYQRKLAATIFASPPSCTYEEAKSHFIHAESLDPGFYTANQLMLAKVCIRLGQKEEAKSWLDKLLKLQAKTESDKKNIEEGENLAKTL